MKYYLLVFLVLVCSLAVGCNKNLSYTFEIPKEEIQKKISEKFPVKPKNEGKEGTALELTISNPEVLLEEGKDQIGLRVSIVAETEDTLKEKLPDRSDIKASSLPAAKVDDTGRDPRPKLREREVLKDRERPVLGEKRDRPQVLSIAKPSFNGTATILTSVSYDSDKKVIRLSNPKITKLDIERLPERLNEAVRRMSEEKLAEKLAEKEIPLKSETAFDKAVKTFLKSVTVKNGKLLVEVGW